MEKMRGISEKIIGGLIGEKQGATRREACGRLSGITGISANAVLGVAKLIIGIFTGSMAVMADSVNNLTDTASSVATLIGFKLAARKKDVKHPFGHARIEYMTGVAIAAMVTVVGVQLAIKSIEGIMHPVHVSISPALTVFFILLIALKAVLWRFNLALANDISSKAIKATAIDCRNDVVVSAGALFSVLTDKFAGISTDGYVGVAIAVFIVISGLKLVIETAAPLLGEAPDKKIVQELSSFILSYKGVIGIHDLVIHDYGPGKVFASVHTEVDAREDIMKSHEVVDMIERDVKRLLGLELVCHMDPIDASDPLVYELKEALTRAFALIPSVKNLHDLRIIRGPTRTNVIFDVVTPAGSDETIECEIQSIAEKALAGIGENYIPVITYDTSYAGEDQ
jgi:cation diffusion facilitator family transporter